MLVEGPAWSCRAYGLDGVGVLNAVRSPFRIRFLLRMGVLRICTTRGAALGGEQGEVRGWGGRRGGGRQRDLRHRTAAAERSLAPPRLAQWRRWRPAGILQSCPLAAAGYGCFAGFAQPNKGLEIARIMIYLGLFLDLTPAAPAPVQLYIVASRVTTRTPVKLRTWPDPQPPRPPPRPRSSATAPTHRRCSGD